MELPACVGVVHESGSRRQEWDRLRRRDEVRPDFAVYSANNAALDQIMFGADHLVDLAAAVPDVLAERDHAWAQEDPATLDFQDALQVLATLVFRPPVPAAQHALARVLHLRGWLPHDRVHPALACRPEQEDDLLIPALERLGLR